MARKSESQNPSQPVSTADGAHHGSYTVSQGMIRVSYNHHSKVTQLGGLSASPESLAGIMLAELVREFPADSLK